MSTSTLDALLDEDQNFDPVTVDGLSNHLPMGLIGLERLGADDDHLRRFATRWRQHLVPCRSASDPIAPGAWKDCLGTGRRYGDLRSFFADAVDTHGVDSTLEDVLPRLLEGVGGAAFHGVIRLAYALEHGRAGDIVCALASLADVDDPVVSTGASERDRDTAVSLANVLSLLAEDRATAHRPRGPGSFSDDFHAVANDARFCEIAGRLTVDDTTLAQTAAMAHALYRSSRDFFALHTVTGTHAARIAIERLGDSDQRVRAAGALARAVAAAYVVIGTPAVQPDEPRADEAALPGWAAIARSAIDSDDVHTIKMTYSCRQEQQFRGDPRYQGSAAELVGLA